MKSLIHVVMIFSLFIAVSACEPKKVEKNVWDDQTKALEKAREVEGALMKKAEDMQNELENLDAEDIPNR